MTNHQDRLQNDSAGGTGTESPSRIYLLEHNCNSEPEPGMDNPVQVTGHPTSPVEKRPRKKRCGRMTLFGSRKDGRFAYHRLRCKAYNCGYCRDWKLRQVRKRIAQLANQHSLSRMLTLTLNPAKVPVGEDPIRYLRYCWHKMCQYLRRFEGHAVTFISVLEMQPHSGFPHLHLLVQSYLPKTWVNNAWSAVGGGYSDIRQVDVHRVTAYLAKYFTKESVREIPDGVRRFTFSHGLVLWPRVKSDDNWKLLRTEIEQVRARITSIWDERFQTEPDGSVVLAFFTSDQSILEHELRC